MKILVIDNYDSFTYNLVQLLGALKCEVVIKQNDELKISDISKINPDKILISPGPGKPEDSKINSIWWKGNYCTKIITRKNFFNTS